MQIHRGLRPSQPIGRDARVRPVIIGAADMYAQTQSDHVRPNPSSVLSAAVRLDAVSTMVNTKIDGGKFLFPSKNLKP